MKHLFRVTSKRPPVIEIDAQALAAYVRFQVGVKVARSVENGPLVIDIDSGGNVIGVELIGVPEFSISTIVERMKPVDSRGINWQRARFVDARDRTETTESELAHA